MLRNRQEKYEKINRESWLKITWEKLIKHRKTKIQATKRKGKKNSVLRNRHDKYKKINRERELVEDNMGKANKAWEYKQQKEKAKKI